MEIYHFINYSKDDIIDYIRKIKNSKAVICLDLEDSIQDIFNPQNTSGLKELHRKFIRCQNFQGDTLQNVKFGIRINSSFTKEITLDLDLLRELKNKINFNSIFLSKTETPDDIIKLEKKLNEQQIYHEEIIAVIETKKGFVNLNKIISIHGSKLTKIAFGHCDFNFDNNIFPFHHQCSEIYWNWLNEIVCISKANAIGFVNSPYLQLDNDKGFQEMMSRVNIICEKNWGQITLTHHQSLLCRNFEMMPEVKWKKKNIAFINLKTYALSVVSSFVKFNNQKGFTITGKKRILISPHEYKAALKYLEEHEY
ncbi:MAG: aldolase/citrate lyase family protein [bacterium]